MSERKKSLLDKGKSLIPSIQKKTTDEQSSQSSRQEREQSTLNDEPEGLLLQTPPVETSTIDVQPYFIQQPTTRFLHPVEERISTPIKDSEVSPAETSIPQTPLKSSAPEFPEDQTSHTISEQKETNVSHEETPGTIEKPIEISEFAEEIPKPKPDEVAEKTTEPIEKPVETIGEFPPVSTTPDQRSITPTIKEQTVTQAIPAPMESVTVKAEEIPNPITKSISRRQQSIAPKTNKILVKKEKSAKTAAITSTISSIKKMWNENWLFRTFIYIVAGFSSIPICILVGWSITSAVIVVGIAGICIGITETISAGIAMVIFLPIAGIIVFCVFVVAILAAICYAGFTLITYLCDLVGIGGRIYIKDNDAFRLGALHNQRKMDKITVY
ncbi:8114_t:CDS:1 [Ambispora gerdemannii]|uniref:8114_t:CDS:1 n=1 Tax=Ambispora gerdemannii TaxID=144530 RepID=A0A9N8V0M1_9GLOM|nr:8114_t:CDS:1 [Ambispora gerdemannii]